MLVLDRPDVLESRCSHCARRGCVVGVALAPDRLSSEGCEAVVDGTAQSLGGVALGTLIAIDNEGEVNVSDAAAGASKADPPDDVAG